MPPRFGPATCVSRRRSARCGPHPEAVDRGSLSASVASQPGRAQSSPVADSSPSSGWDPYASEEWVVASDAEPGCATQAETVERSRTEGITRVSTGGLGGTASTGFTAAAQRAEPPDRQVGSGRRACGAATPASVSADDSTGVGPITALAFVITMGDVTRFQRGKQVASYLGGRCSMTRSILQT